MRQDPARNYISENSLPDRISRWIIGIIHLKYTETGINLETLVFPFLLIIYVIDICQPDDITRPSLKLATLSWAPPTREKSPFLNASLAWVTTCWSPLSNIPYWGPTRMLKKGIGRKLSRTGMLR